MFFTTQSTIELYRFFGQVKTKKKTTFWIEAIRVGSKNLVIYRTGFFIKTSPARVTFWQLIVVFKMAHTIVKYFINHLLGTRPGVLLFLTDLENWSPFLLLSSTEKFMTFRSLFLAFIAFSAFKMSSARQQTFKNSQFFIKINRKLNLFLVFW